MKTIKIIDLFNKIANGEEVPKKIEYKDVIREYTNDYKDYISMNGADFYLFYDVLTKAPGDLFVSALNDEVEIIEEDNEIEYLHFHDLTEPTENEKILIVQINKLNDLIKKALNNSTNR